MSTAAIDTFAADWADWRAERDRQLAEPYSILAITSINYLTDQPVAIARIPGLWSTSAQGPVVELADGDELTDGDTVLSGRVEIGSVAHGARFLNFGEMLIQVMHVAGWDIVRPYDPQAPLRTSFVSTPSYAPDPSWQITGRWLPYATARQTEIGSVQERLGYVVQSPGEVEFELDGRLHRLIATPAHGAPDHVALHFRDRTSGVTTFAALRELIVRPPDSGGEIELDFNRARNKNCAYTDLAICPLPPAGNFVDVSIEAGELTPYERFTGTL